MKHLKSIFYHFILILVSCGKHIHSTGAIVMPLVNDSLLFFIKNDSVNLSRFNAYYASNYILYDSTIIKKEYKKYDRSIFEILNKDTVMRKSVLVKRYNAFTKQVTFYSKNGVKFIRVFYFLSDRTQLKLPQNYFLLFCNGILAPVNCDIYQYEVVYSIKEGNYSSSSFHCF